MHRHQRRRQPTLQATVIILPIKRRLSDPSMQQIVSRIPHAGLIFVRISEQIFPAKCAPVPNQRRRDRPHQPHLYRQKNELPPPRQNLGLPRILGRRGRGIARSGIGHPFTLYYDALLFFALQIIPVQLLLGVVYLGYSIQQPKFLHKHSTGEMEEI